MNDRTEPKKQQTIGREEKINLFPGAEFAENGGQLSMLKGGSNEPPNGNIRIAYFKPNFVLTVTPETAAALEAKLKEMGMCCNEFFGLAASDAISKLLSETTRENAQ